MTSKKLIGMVIALAVLAGIALMQNKGGNKHRADMDKTAATLLQGLDLNTVDGVAIAEGSDSVELVKQDGKWVVGSLFNYPADFKKLADALRAASEVTMGSPVRSANVDAAEFGLDKAKSIVLKTGGNDAVKLAVGARREASNTAGWANQHFVQKGGADDIYLVDYDFRPFTEESDDWIDTELINVSSSDIVSVKAGDMELNSVSNTWTLADLDEETEEFQSSEANKLRMALQYLNCTTVADPAMTDADLGFTNAVAYTASTTNKSYTVTLGGEADNGRYLRLSGDVPEKVNGWTYVVSTYEANDFLLTRDKLVKAKEPEEEEAN
ncbi:hypothetical protein PDESU_05074 [Pontiella desulfatans]|uniref:DUF4340 domain-containing protein n=1 Tax=Pontiella desulfatans TaxID=2750659 RepID=A0A6C2U9F0_PONDE|nr:DUF4340 domain-containing protein [Pontiella desulfatans]VGO16483.1 hypothetical protein PDESU_05074 [Pontiella desulfatans]